MSQITMRIYPPYALGGIEWTVEAEVYDDWAVHQAHKDDDPGLLGYPWHVTHVPSGAMAFVAEHKRDASLAALKLSSIEQPSVAILPAGRSVPKVSPLPIEWIELAAAVQGIDVWVVGSSSLIRPEGLVKYVMNRRAQHE